MDQFSRCVAIGNRDYKAASVAFVPPHGYSLAFSGAAYAAFLRFLGLRFQLMFQE
jgi:hypothetical protein